MDQKNNAKCPFCGAELYVSLTKGDALCTSCKKQFDVEKAIKLLKSVEEQEKKEEVLVASGEDYLKVDKLLTRAEYFLEHKDYESAKKELLEALKITNSDYRVYFSLVRAETKNLTDYKNQSHKLYLDKAIACADLDEKSKIMRLYKDFYQLSKCSDEDIEQYKKEENLAIKSKLEKKFKEIIPYYMKLERGQNVKKILFPIIGVIGGAGLIVGFILLNSYIMLPGAALCLLAYFFGRTFFVNRRTIKNFNALLDVYDQLLSFNLNNTEMRKVLDSMIICAKAFNEKHNEQQIENEMYHFVQIVYEGENQGACEFVSQHPVLKEFYKYFVEEKQEQEN